MAAGRTRGRAAMAKRTARRPPQRSTPKRRPAPAAKSRPRPKSRARSRARRPHLPRVRLSDVDQTTVDAIGLGLVACGLPLGFLVWTGSGAVGEGVADVFRFLVGGVAYLLPAFVIGAGIALAARQRIESPGRLRAGAIALVLGLALGLAAGTLGLGPGGGDIRDLWGLDAMMERGGVVGESLYWATSTLFSHPGAHLVFFFLMAGGVLLVTGLRIGDLVGGVRAAAAHARGRLASELEHARADARG